MITFPLNLKLSPAAVHPPAAWFIPGADAGVWLEEIARWELPMAGMKLYVVPTSLRDRTPIGVLVTMAEKGAPASVLRARPYGQLAGRLFLPVDAILDPPVTDAELRQVLRFDVQVLHPSARLTGFEATDALRVHDLLIAPALREVSWDHAAAGEAVRDRLLGVEPERVPDLDDILDGGRGDIGSHAPEALPPGADESKLRELAQRAAVPPIKLAEIASRGAMRFMNWLGGQASGAGAGSASGGKGGSAPGWLKGLRDWASKFEQLSRPLLDARLRELERLRKLLQNDPDEGLRYAIPLRDVGSRGRSRPGWQLSRRDPTFNLSRLFGGGAAGDAWTVPPDMIQSLRQRYREAANRELGLGRFRRAAYIFAELLGDFSSAANALEQGRFYREAAILYRDRLKNAKKAAECLEHGGLLGEAIAIYEELQLFEKAGDLYARLERSEEAERCYREQVEAYRGKSDFLAAARLLETKVHSPDEALDTLTRAWPRHDAAGTCLRAAFGLLGRLGRHEETLSRIHRLRDDAPPAGLTVTVAQVLADVAISYPDALIRHRGADATRVVAGRQLVAQDAEDRQPIAQAVARLAPEDRLLSRDVERFLARAPKRPSQPPKARASGDPAVLRQFYLGDSLGWKAAAADADGFYVLAQGGAGVHVFRGTWDGKTELVYYERNPANADDITWSLHPVPGKPLIVIATGADGTPAAFSGNATSTKYESVVPNWFPIGDPVGGRLAVGVNGTGLTWILSGYPPDSLTLDAHRTDTGVLIASHALTDVPPPPDAPLQMVARSEHVYVSWGSAILRFGPISGLKVEPMPGPVRQLAISAPYTRLRVAAALDEGGMLLFEHGRNHRFGDGLTRPMIAFTRGGTLVAADAKAGRIYRTDAGEPRRRGEFPGPGPGLIAITPTHRLNEFATFTREGKVTVYAIPD